MLVFELRKGSSGDYYVRVVYNGKQIALPVLVPASNGLYSLADLTTYAAFPHVSQPNTHSLSQAHLLSIS